VPIDLNTKFYKQSKLTPKFKKKALISALSILLPITSFSLNFDVTEMTDDGTGNSINSLSWALLQANTSPGDDSITLKTDVKITGVMKRLLDSNITLQSDATQRVIDGDNKFRPLFIKSGNVIIKNIDMVNGLAKGGDSQGGGGGAGMGGSLFIYDGNVFLENMNVSQSKAVSGSGTGAPGYTSGGGGGGMFGNSNLNGGGGLFAHANSSNGAYSGYGNYQSLDSKFGQGGSWIDAYNSSNGGFGGGGAFGYRDKGSNGGFGGGGGQGYYSDGGDGGFGGGKGFSYYNSSGRPGFGTVDDFGAAMGGALFVRSGEVVLKDVSFSNNQAKSFEGAQAMGGAIFVLHTLNMFNNNNQGMPSVLPDVWACNMSFSQNTIDWNNEVTEQDIYYLGNIFPQTDLCEQEIEVSTDNNTIIDGFNLNIFQLNRFSPVSIYNESSSRTFTIANKSGLYDLTLTGSPLVTINGIDAADFTVTTQPNLSFLPKFSSTDFIVTFDPQSPGEKTATITIDNDDSDENPYDFSIFADALAPEINLFGNGGDINDGDNMASIDNNTQFGSSLIGVSTITKIFRIRNTGSLDLNLTGSPIVEIIGADSGEFNVTSQPSTNVLNRWDYYDFEITFTPSSLGTKTVRVSIDNDDFDENPFDFVIEGTGLGGEISVTGNTIEILDEDITPSIDDNTDLGMAFVNNAMVTKPFTIENISPVELNLTNTPLVMLTGVDSLEFTISMQPGLSIVPPFGSTNFEVTFTPTSMGLKTATISIDNDDSDENPYNFSIQGVGIGPEIEILGNNISIADGDLTPTITDGTDLGPSAVSQLFSIANIGVFDLTLTGNPFVTLSGVDAGEFSVSMQAASSTIAPASSLDFEISFTPTSIGRKYATVSLASDDYDEGSYFFSIQAGVPQIPDIAISQNGVSYINEATFTHDLWTNVISYNSAEVDFEIQNNGLVDLELGSLTSSHSDFSISQLTSSVIPPNTSASFTVTFFPRSSGLIQSILTINNNDPDDLNFLLNLEGTSIPLLYTSDNTNVVREGEVLEYSAFLNSIALSDILLNYTIFGDVDASDFVSNSLSGQVQINQGENYSTIEIPVANDSLFEGSESLVITFSSPNTDVYHGNLIEVGQIIDDTVYQNGFESIDVTTFLKYFSQRLEGIIEKPVFNEVTNTVEFANNIYQINQEGSDFDLIVLKKWLQAVLEQYRAENTNTEDANGY